LIKKILYTIISKAGVSILNFFTLMLSARMLGPSLRGEASLLLASVNILIYIAGVIGGPSLINHCKTIKLKKYIHQYYFISATILFVFNIAMVGLNFVSFEMGIHQFILSVILAIYISQQYILTGNNQIKAFNISQLLQALLPLLILVFFYIVSDGDSLAFSNFLIAIYCSFLIPLIYTSIQTKSYIYQSDSAHLSEWTISEAFKSGVVSQLSNIIQFFNYRLVFYILGWYYIDKAIVGEYALAVALAEAVWIIGRSIGLVQLGDLLNKESTNYHYKSNIYQLAMVSGVVSVLAITVLCFVPQHIFQLLVGTKYIYTHDILLYLAPATVIFSFQFSFSSFFASQNKYYISNYAATLSLVCLLVASFFLIKYYQVYGAALATGIGYLASTLFFYVSFYRYKKVHD
jgi:O-antigen/teichoic acid export membrane protein